MEFEQQQFKDFFSSPEKIGAGVQEKECSITMPAAVESLAALCQRWWPLVAGVWQRDFRAPFESGLTAIFLEAC
jgi:hypothetical protein